MGQVRINEVIREVLDTPSSNGLNDYGTLPPVAFQSDDGGREFIELYNTSGSPVDISGWGIRYTILGGAGSGVPTGYVLSGAPNSSWAIERALELTGPWTNLSALLIGTNGSTQFQDTNSAYPAGFYRALQQ